MLSAMSSTSFVNNDVDCKALEPAFLTMRRLSDVICHQNTKCRPGEKLNLASQSRGNGFASFNRV